MSLLVATPAMAVEGIRRWVILPRVARLNQGSRAVVALKIMPRIQARISTGPALMVRDGAKVRVEDDSDPISMEGIRTTAGGELVGDFRKVRITLLEGQDAGQSIQLGRCLLQPLR